jgi:hypothetical protein
MMVAKPRRGEHQRLAFADRLGGTHNLHGLRGQHHLVRPAHLHARSGNHPQARVQVELVAVARRESSTLAANGRLGEADASYALLYGRM